MGVIYICKDLQIERILAFKGLNKRIIDFPEAKLRLQREAELWLDLAKHPNIVPLRFTCDIHHQKFLVMDAILPCSERGNTLLSWMKLKNRSRNKPQFVSPDMNSLETLQNHHLFFSSLIKSGEGLNFEEGMDLETILNFSIQICNGIIHATKEFKKKDRMFVHGDLHPGNILIEEKSKNDAVLKITDFGLVRDQKTWSQKYLGTLQFTAPERWNNTKEIDQRADIYSFGCLMYLMISGHPPFYGLNSAEYHQAHCVEEPKPPFDFSEHLTPGSNELTDFVLKCLKKNPDDRYFDFNECHADLVLLYRDIFGKQVIIKENEIQINIVDYFYRGLAYNGINLPKQAEDAYRKILKIDPNDTNALFNLGNLLKNQNRPEEAEKTWRKALEIDPIFAQVWNNLGILLKDQKRPDEAEDAYRIVLEINPNDAQAWSNLGVLLKDQKRPDEAERAYRKALEIDPKYVNAWNNLGVILSEKKRPDEAERAYRKALEIDSKYIHAWYNLGVLLSDQKLPNEAEVAYLKILGIDPTDAKTWSNLGVVLSKQNRPKEAESAYRKALNLNPKDVKAWNNLGLLFANRNRPKDAEVAYRNALKIDPNYILAWNNLGNILQKYNYMKEAEETYRKALELDPKNASIWNNLGFLLVKQNRYEETVEVYKKILELDHDNNSTLYNLACIYGLQSNVSESIKYLKLAIEKDPKYKKMACTDSDFDSIRDSPEFRELIK